MKILAVILCIICLVAYSCCAGAVAYNWICKRKVISMFYFMDTIICAIGLIFLVMICLF